MNHEHPLYRVWLKVIVSIFVIMCVFGFGVYIGFDSGSHRVGASERVDLSEFWKVWDLIEKKYVPASSTKPVTDKQKVYGAIKGLVESLGDPYSVFMPPEERKSFEEDIRGNFEGVGMEVGIRDGILTVVAPLKDTPAYKAGIKAGDKIVKIGDVSTKDMPVDSAVKLMRGKAGTVVNLEIIRDAKTLNLSITRAVIVIPTVETEYKSKDKIFIIRLFSFSANASNEFRNALREFTNTKSNRLIIDLRNNPGGYLEAAIDIASWFLPAGNIVVTEDFGGDTPAEVFRSKGYDAFTKKLNIVILVNGGSASASEILAGALNEHGRAVLVGEKTFGKGSVQELIPVSKETSFKVTIARWLTPKGNSISDTGITPDHVVDISDEDIKANKDPQLEKAIQVLKAMK